MVQTPKPRSRKKPAAEVQVGPAAPRRWRVWIWIKRGLAGVAGFYAVLILLFSFLPPPINLYQLSEAWRLGGISKDWTSWDNIAPSMGRSVVAGEDANFCLHWGFDIAAIKLAAAEGANRGASTLTQQVAKNVFLWQARSWVRKAMEAMLTPAIELVWSKQRILEVYLNVAEFGDGIFGVQAAAQHYFGVNAADLSPTQAARLAAVLPDPKGRNPAKPSAFVKRRAGAILSGADTIAADGRAACFQ